MTGLLSWGQAGEYNAVDDRGVIAAVAGQRRGLTQAPTLTAQVGLDVMVGPFLGVLDAGDGTATVARSDDQVPIPIAPGPAVGARTDVLWLDLDVERAIWEILPLQEADLVGRLGISLGRVTMPTNANTVLQATLIEVQPTYDTGAQTGDLKLRASAAPHLGWLLCDGGQHQAADYPELAAFFGVETGAFLVPDLRGRVPIGANGPGGNQQPTCPVGGTTANGVTGEARHQLSHNEMPGHNHGGGTHGVGDHAHTTDTFVYYEPSVEGLSLSPSATRATRSNPGSSGAGGHNHGLNIDGANWDHNNMPPMWGVAYFIKT